mmetsp:Transcript_105771/g.299194  ORF Transcript_105771/g.299194 Transcript_105771/m.299194 type:complete len:125 (-) Transcript_105771:113-487(-)
MKNHMKNNIEKTLAKMGNGAKDVFNEMDNQVKGVSNKVTKAKDDVFGVQDGTEKQQRIKHDTDITKLIKENKAKKEKRDDVKATKEMYANQKGNTKIDETKELTRDMTEGMLSNIFEGDDDDDW